MRLSGARFAGAWLTCGFAITLALAACAGDAPDTTRIGSGAASATKLTSPVRPAAEEQSGESDPATGTWQVEEMRFDLLPGSPPGDGVVIATIETGGVDADHPSLDGAVEDGHHIDYWTMTTGAQPMAVAAQNGVSDPSVHATGVASLMVGQPSGAVPGIAPGATVYPINIGDGRESDMVRGITWAVDVGVDVINVSQVLECAKVLVFSNCPDDVRDATDYAERHGVVVVAAAGNNGGGSGCTGDADAEQWPAVLETVISVGANEPGGEPWSCTPSRPDLDVLAPGVQLLFADVGGGYAVGEGTSFAAPLVSGLIAVMLGERPELTPADIRQRLPAWVHPGGRLDVSSALRMLDAAEPGEGEHVR